MKIKISSIILALISSFSVASQDLTYAKEVVKILASPAYYGRGYVENGEKIAARYIGSEFERIGLSPFEKNYFQEFTISVNTFPSTMKLTINGQQKIAGVDYLIDAGSPSISGQFENSYLPVDDMLDQEKLVPILRSATNRFLIIPPFKQKDYTKDQQKQITDVINFIKYHPDSPASGTIVLTNQKLTWGGSTYQYDKPSFTLKEDSIQSIEQVDVEVKSEFFSDYTTQNVIGYIEGQQPDSLIVIVAHYDHLGMMGSNARFPGANDNASGIALLLDLAGYYAASPPKYRMAFIAFGAEELGLLGAKYFVNNPLFDLSKIKFLLNFDISGTGDEGIQVVNGSVYRDQFDQLVKINEEKELMTQVKIRGAACISDHCMFHMQDVPCFYIYTLGGIQAYHDIYDKSETLPLSEYEDYFKLITSFIDQL